MKTTIILRNLKIFTGISLMKGRIFYKFALIMNDTD